MLNVLELAIPVYCPGKFVWWQVDWCMNPRECYPHADSPVSEQELAIVEAALRWAEERIL